MLGLDITDIARMQRAASHAHFVRRVFTEREREYYAQSGSRTETLAGMFAAKEAAAKAFGTGFRGFALTDIEILHDEQGRPYYAFYGHAAVLCGKRSAVLSISHAAGVAAAVCLLIKE